MTKYTYFISYAYSGEGASKGFGSTCVDLDSPIISNDDIATVSSGIRDDKYRGVAILNFILINTSKEEE